MNSEQPTFRTRLASVWAMLTTVWKSLSVKRQFVLVFFAIVLLMAGGRRIYLSATAPDEPVEDVVAQPVPTVVAATQKHRILSVPNYQAAFPDSQSVQIVAANKWGVRPVKNREDAEARKKELVYVGESPYYHVDPLHSSIPYLVPRAALLLQDIGQAFYDSLYMKGVPINQLIVTSVMRSMEDVRKLQRHNGNATDNSCHLYGTTFDICYNRYHAVDREVRNDTLKWVLSEVLRDIRCDNRAYIKYEVKQGCFHMTVR